MKTKKEKVDEADALEKKILDYEAKSNVERPGEFKNFPISTRTLKSLDAKNFKNPTQIQLLTIPHALKGKDILGAASTGSGKTLAFLIPLVEKLFRLRWDESDGLAALVVSPTRELSVQIFEVLRNIAKNHVFTAGLIIGGKSDFKAEQAMVPFMNVLVSTPGRLLQHLEQTPGFDASQIEVFVLDEADRLLDMGFKDEVNGILSYLPRERQTMLFSATQTKSVKDLARLSLNMKNVEYVFTSEMRAEEGSGESEATGAVPDRIVQNYVVCELKDKLSVLFGFIRTHLKSKIIVFLSSCAQVRFVYELFCSLQPGVPLLALHGKLKQHARTEMYFKFCNKKYGVLFATDIVSRGLDFPTVDWVIQVDAPEDATAYIHRTGRTARYKSKGRGLLFLLPKEENGMVQILEKRKISIKKLSINSSKVKDTSSFSSKVSSFLAANIGKKSLAEKAFTSYVRSIQLMPNRAIFNNGRDLELESFAFSLGLPSVPKMKGSVVSTDIGENEREAARKKKNVNRSLQRLKEQIKAEKEKKKDRREGKEESGTKESEESNSESGLLTFKKRISPDDENVRTNRIESQMENKEAKITKKAKKMKLSIDSTGKSVSASAAQKIRFDDFGLEKVADTEKTELRKSPNDFKVLELKYSLENYAVKVQNRLKQTAEVDRLREKQRISEKRKNKKAKLKAANERCYEGSPARENADSSEGESDDSESSVDLEEKALELLRKR